MKKNFYKGNKCRDGLYMRAKNKGFTAIELLVVIGLTAILATITVTTFISFSNFQSIDKDADATVSYIQRARSQTINSKNNIQYGVKFASTTVTLFQGTVYNALATTNVVYTISTKTALSSIQLTGNVTSIYFLPITGKPNATGTIAYKLSADASTTKSVIIYGSGLAEVQ